MAHVVHTISSLLLHIRLESPHVDHRISRRCKAECRHKASLGTWPFALAAAGQPAGMVDMSAAGCECMGVSQAGATDEPRSRLRVGKLRELSDGCHVTYRSQPRATNSLTRGAIFFSVALIPPSIVTHFEGYHARFPVRTGCTYVPHTMIYAVGILQGNARLPCHGRYAPAL
jgi:hypothetical protein